MNKGRSPEGPVPVRIAYLLEEFPKLSESFIIEELKELRDKGAIAGIYSISRPTSLSDKYPELMDLVVYPTRSSVIRSNLRWMFSGWYWKWLLRTLRHYPSKILAFFRTISFLSDMETTQPHHLHSHFATFASYMTWALAEKQAIPFSLTVHATGIFTERKLIKERIFDSAFTVTISDFNRKFMNREFGVLEEGVNIVHCGIRPETFSDLREKRKMRMENNGAIEKMENKSAIERVESCNGIVKNPIRIFTIGRLVEKKGFHILINTLEEIRETDDNWEARIAGSGPMEDELRNAIEDKGLGDRVSLLGRISDEQLLDELVKADIFVLPCMKATNGDMDGIPVVLMEALACGIPTISTRISGIPELIEDGVNGRLVEPGSPGELARAIRDLMGDPDRANQLGQAAVTKVMDEFNIQKNAAELLDLFSDTRNEG